MSWAAGLKKCFPEVLSVLMEATALAMGCYYSTWEIPPDAASMTKEERDAATIKAGFGRFWEVYKKLNPEGKSKSRAVFGEVVRRQAKEITSISPTPSQSLVMRLFVARWSLSSDPVSRNLQKTGCLSGAKMT